MPHPKPSLNLATLSAAGVLVVAAYAHAEQAPQKVPVPIPVPPMWTEPPEAVKAAASTLRTACAAWTGRVSPSDTSNPADALRTRPEEVTVCEAATSPEEFRSTQQASYIVLAAAVVGLALASFVAAGFFVRFVAMWVRWGAEAAWDTWPSFRRRYR